MFGIDGKHNHFEKTRLQGGSGAIKDGFMPPKGGKRSSAKRFKSIDVYALMVIRGKDIPEPDEESFDSEPPMSLDKFIEGTGLSTATIWRFRKKGFLQTVNICGRHYVLRSEIARFNKRATAGEFAKPCNHPRRKGRLGSVDAH